MRSFLFRSLFKYSNVICYSSFKVPKVSISTLNRLYLTRTASSSHPYGSQHYGQQDHNTRLLPIASSVQSKCLNSNFQYERQISVSERLVQSLPTQLIPYAMLMRLNKPTGTWLLLWPCYWSIALATAPGTLPSASLLAMFGAGALLLRSSGCIINDLWDQKFDARVARTKGRPIASGQISSMNAMVLLHGLNASGLLIAMQFDLNSIYLALSSMAIVVIYPTCKRFTNWAQVVLGMAFNWGALLGWSVVCNGSLDLYAVLPLYLSGICWTLVYDTIYAHQDKADDAKLGLKSTALKFGERTSEYLYGFTGLMASSLLVAGLNTGQCWPYYLSVGACAAQLVRIIRKTNMNNVEQCGKAFNDNIHIGWILFGGIVASTLMKKRADDEDKDENSQITNDQTQ